MLLRSTDKFCITIIVVVFLLPPLVVNSDEQEDQWGPEIGSDAPSIDLVDAEGNKRTINDLRGDEEGLLLFFCSQTSNYRDVLLSDLQEHYQRLVDEGFAIVAITNDEVEENNERKKLLKLEYPLLSDHNLEGVKKYDVLVLNIKNEETIIPGVVLIDSDNKVTFTKEFKSIIMHSDHTDGSYSNRYFHEPSIGEILKSLLTLSTDSTHDNNWDNYLKLPL